MRIVIDIDQATRRIKNWVDNQIPGHRHPKEFHCSCGTKSEWGVLDCHNCGAMNVLVLEWDHVKHGGTSLEKLIKHRTGIFVKKWEKRERAIKKTRREEKRRLRGASA